MEDRAFPEGGRAGLRAVQGEIASSPGFYQHIAPADAADESYLMAWASTLFSG